MVTLGTRGSELALRQTELVSRLLRDHHADLEIHIDVIQTDADRFQHLPLEELGDKGVFVRGIERALLEGRIDMAVHSLKDVPADIVTPGLMLAAFSAREDPRDVVVSRTGAQFMDLARGSRVGTSSLRRRVQLRAQRADLSYADIRGNVDTRLRKLDEGEYDAIVVAAAGLKRLGLENRITQYLTIGECLPDAGQGIVTVQTRDSGDVGTLAATIDDADSRTCALAERAAVQAMDADCRSPVGVHATLADGTVYVSGVAAGADGKTLHRASVQGSNAQPQMVGQALGRRLLSILGRG